MAQILTKKDLINKYFNVESHVQFKSLNDTKLLLNINYSIKLITNELIEVDVQYNGFDMEKDEIFKEKCSHCYFGKKLMHVYLNTSINLKNVSIHFHQEEFLRESYLKNRKEIFYAFFDSEKLPDFLKINENEIFNNVTNDEIIDNEAIKIVTPLNSQYTDEQLKNNINNMFYLYEDRLKYLNEKLILMQITLIIILVLDWCYEFLQ